MRQTSQNPFSLRAVLALVVIGFLAFIALLYFIGTGNTGRQSNDGRAHAASVGLNGFAGLVKLLEAEGVEVTTSRSPSGLESYGLVVLTPPPYADPEEISEILLDRQYRGPTLVILPKWYATGFSDRLPDEIKDEVKEGWVQLLSPAMVGWTDDLPQPYAFSGELDEIENGVGSWSGLGHAGALPTKWTTFAKVEADQEALVTDQSGRTLAIDIIGAENSEFYDNAHGAVFIVEPDLVNNYGLADANRAALALELVRYAGYYDENMAVTFDLTLNGFGGSTNLLTLAFRPPFLAATLCLILALLVIGWRAFRRFGPPAAEGPAIAFGKHRLIANGAGLILRAKRLRLLAEPYVAITQARLSKTLGLGHAEPAEIDAALARRLPDERPFTHRAADMRSARSDAEILLAARALKELEGKLHR
ncbi:hypothetical protein SAMN06297468_1765 [Altererythrobacter xiamenensis]|uniref:DUF4350 domain-containing protein n=1 Tax=Altererythrobacter xiamenensis TaxID=1316679 RepID=A0A1Y6F7N3_9SPHN|nr:DUF4350 domain-containing protein [Altererythrobacter xiamenensis]SMQ69581.1 hypothetical protein SAMN06297468_1765 [Altererythrobacter xiamenensis]